jgi:hypothetical protein
MSDSERGEEPQRDPVGSTPPPTGERPDRAAKGGRFLTRYAGLPEVGWGGGMVALGVLVAAGTMLAGTIFVAIFDPSLETSAARNAAQLVVAASLIGTALGFALFDSHGAVKEAFGKLGLGGRIAVGAIGLALLAWLAYIIFAGFLAPLLQPDQEDVTRELGTNKDELGSVAVAAFLIVIAAPLSEELFFRGFMFGGAAPLDVDLAGGGDLRRGLGVAPPRRRQHRRRDPARRVRGHPRLALRAHGNALGAGPGARDQQHDRIRAARHRRPLTAAPRPMMRATCARVIVSRSSYPFSSSP